MVLELDGLICRPPEAKIPFLVLEDFFVLSYFSRVAKLPLPSEGEAGQGPAGRLRGPNEPAGHLFSPSACPSAS